MAKTGDGASGINIEDKCPICGEDPKKNKCVVGRDIMICPNEGDCKNQDAENDHRRTNCVGYLCGNMGIGTFLGSNILSHSYNTLKLEPRVPFFSAKIWRSYRKKIVKSNAAIIANLKGVTTKQETMLANELDKVDNDTDNRTIYQYGPHPLYTGGRSIEAHHLICSEVMKSEDWRAFCKMTGYNINCYKNGVFLPGKLPLACATKVPLHSGNHDEGYGGGVSYVDQVKEKVNSVLSDAGENEVCKSPDNLKTLVEKLNELSKEIFDKIEKFDWTITWDGFDYQQGNPIGCANQTRISDKRGTRKKTKYSKEAKEMQGALKTEKDTREAIASSIKEAKEKQRAVENFFKEVVENEKTRKDDTKGGRFETLLCSCKRKHEEIQNVNKPYQLELGK